MSEVIYEALAGGRPERRLDPISPVRRNLSIRAFPTGGPEIDGAVAVVEDICERFYRVDRARSRAAGGAGLGLSIVRHVAANHGALCGCNPSRGRARGCCSSYQRCR